jgi:hypothetical protein
MAKYTALDIFTQGLRMAYSAEVLMKHVADTWKKAEGTVKISNEVADNYTLPAVPPTMISAFVCEAFAVELYLKSILKAENIPYGKRGSKHLIDWYFGRLTDKWKTEIEANYLSEINKERYENTRMIPGFPMSIKSCLSQASESFKKWRYLYEYRPAFHFLFPAIPAIYNAVVNFKPEWDGLRQNLNTPPTSQVR